MTSLQHECNVGWSFSRWNAWATPRHAPRPAHARTASSGSNAHDGPAYAWCIRSTRSASEPGRSDDGRDAARYGPTSKRSCHVTPCSRTATAIDGAAAADATDAADEPSATAGHATATAHVHASTAIKDEATRAANGGSTTEYADDAPTDGGHTVWDQC